MIKRGKGLSRPKLIHRRRDKIITQPEWATHTQTHDKYNSPDCKSVV